MAESQNLASVLSAWGRAERGEEINKACDRWRETAISDRVVEKKRSRMTGNLDGWVCG